MLKKLRRQFILSAMLAFGLVMLVLITAINVLNASGMRRSQNKQIERILEYEQMTASEPEPLPIREMPWAGGENREFTTRFFVVRCDESGVIRS
ncbi:MAG: two-component sensor histidine kinase, partial [Oscillospiraceae bacterium]|nr:two-component sensor histidine kinase [Oscillospiraceae bacterium]